MLLCYRPVAAVDEISANEDRIGMLCLQQREPTVKVGARVVITQMEVADKNQFHVFFHILLRRHHHLHPLLVVVMEVSEGEQNGQCDGYTS